MESYIIEGGNRLEGQIDISGSKNATLPIMAACVLNNGINTLYNVPNIQDVVIMENILEYLGCKIYRNSDKIVIDSSSINKFSIPEVLMRQMRSSVMLVGAIIGRMSECIFSYPGGCEIGARPIDLHINAFRKLNVLVKEEGGYIYCQTDKISNTEVNLDFPSVGATENIILLSALGEGVTTIKNAAREPEIIDLQNILNKMGAKVNGAGSNVITISGVKKLREVVLDLQIKICNLKKDINNNKEEVNKLNKVLKYKNMKDEYQKININNLFYTVEENEYNAQRNNIILRHKDELIKKLNENIIKQNRIKRNSKKLPKSISQELLFNKKIFDL